MRKIKSFICTMLMLALTLSTFNVFAEGEEDDVKMKDIPLPTYSDDASDISQRSEATVIGLPTYTDINNERLFHEVQMLDIMNIMKGFDDGTFLPDSEITRGECAYIIMKLLNKTVQENPKKYFYDVPSTHAMYGAISVLAELGIISGYQEGVFRPDDPVNLDEILIMTVNALGGNAITQMMGEGNNSYWSAADSFDLLDGISGKNGNEVTRGDVARIVFNALNSNIYTVKFSNGNFTYTRDEDKTFLGEVYDVYTGEGLVTANSITSLSGNTTAKNHLEVGGVDYEISNVVFNDYLGKYVKYYYLYNNNDSRIIYAYEKGGEELVIPARDISSYSDGKIYYSDENGKSKNVTIPQGKKTVILNGKRINDYDSSIFNLDSGTIRLVKSYGERDYSVIFIESYKNYVLDSMSGSDGVISMQMKYNVPAIDLDTADPYCLIELFNEDGNRIDFSMSQSITYNGDGDAVLVTNLPPIDDGAVLSIAADKTEEKGGFIVPSSDATYIKIIVNSTSVIGTVNAISEAGNVTINGDEYDTANDNFLFEKDSILRVGSSGTFLFDADGCLAAWTGDGAEVTEYGWQYGYLIKANYIEEDEKVVLKIMDTDGEKNRYPCAKKIKINNQRNLKVTEIGDYLKTKARLLDNTMTGESQPVKYKLNSNAEISQLQTVMASTGVPSDADADQFNRAANRTEYVSKENTGWSLNIYLYASRSENPTPGSIMFSKPETVFVVPFSPTGNDDDYDIFTMSTWANEDRKTMDVFDCDDMRAPKLAVIYEKVEPQAIYDGYVMVDEVSEVLNDDDEVVYQLSTCTGTTMKNYTADDVDIVSPTVTYADGSQKKRLLMKGDLIKVYGKRTELSAIDLIIPIDNLPDIDTTKPGYGDDKRADGSYTYGKDLSGIHIFNFAEVLKSENRMVLMQNGPITSSVNRTYQRLLNWTNNSAVMKYGAIMYDGDEETVKVANGPQELKSVVSYGESKASKIFTYEGYVDIYQVVVYNNID